VFKLDPNNPRAFYYLASVYELQGKLDEAVKALEASSAQADIRKQAELTAMARFRMGMLMQQMQSQSGPGGRFAATPSPTP
jgi:cytochrome c-type biogenesis protein CcmH/NrfG